MFLVELSYNQIKDKITSLEDKQTKYESAITTSEKNLNEDQIKVKNYLEKDQAETTKFEQDAKDEQTKKLDKLNLQKAKNDDIQQLESQYTKYKEQLATYETHKHFLNQLID